MRIIKYSSLPCCLPAASTISTLRSLTSSFVQVLQYWATESRHTFLQTHRIIKFLTNPFSISSSSLITLPAVAFKNLSIMALCCALVSTDRHCHSQKNTFIYDVLISNKLKVQRSMRKHSQTWVTARLPGHGAELPDQPQATGCIRPAGGRWAMHQSAPMGFEGGISHTWTLARQTVGLKMRLLRFLPWLIIPIQEPSFVRLC
ncbi:Uncharacterized protein HZ326_23099 [Fusarium oxysporum f. sp. albedinis]|nr:Uncharacterized protein HZ326_23099 [Fusarium oxysporum f. sp. albedinis]